MMGRSEVRPPPAEEVAQRKFTPLQLLLFRHSDDLDALPYEEAMARAFQGGKEAGGYLATGEDPGWDEDDDPPVKEGAQGVAALTLIVLQISATATFQR